MATLSSQHTHRPGLAAAQAARALNLSKARISQIMNMLNLPVQIQEAILLGELDLGGRRLREFLGTQ